MKTIFETCVPRDEVLRGELREQQFAASLTKVLRGEADEVYGEPDKFFANTYPTGGLKALLRVIDAAATVSDETLRLARWIARQAVLTLSYVERAGVAGCRPICAAGAGDILKSSNNGCAEFSSRGVAGEMARETPGWSPRGPAPRCRLPRGGGPQRWRRPSGRSRSWAR